MPKQIEIQGAANVPRIDHYFGAWCMLAEVFNSLLSQVVAKMDLAAHVASFVPDSLPTMRDGAYTLTDDGIAVIDINGVMMKHASSMTGGASTVLVRQLIRAAANDSQVKGILLRVDSPGGTVSGTAELARDIRLANKTKPVHAYVDDMACSAACWAVSQAGRRSGNETSVHGSIGVVFSVEDTSAAAEKDGVKVHVISTGSLKGAGVPGSEVTAEQLAEWQGRVDAINGLFLAEVSKGLGMPLDAVQTLATGAVWIGEKAKALGLVDAIESFDEAYSVLVSEVQAKTSNHKDTARMSKPTLSEYRAACPGASDAFLLEQVAAESTLDTAKGDFIAFLALENERLAKAEAAAQAKAEADAKLASAAAGSDDIDADSATADAPAPSDAQSFEAAFKARLKANGGDRYAAMRETILEDEDRHAAYIGQHTAAAKRGDMSVDVRRSRNSKYGVLVGGK